MEDRTVPHLSRSDRRSRSLSLDRDRLVRS
eukprot:COSAG02_NODE_40106_length_409_cov_0.822581_1_plen_29_part_01